MLGCNTVICNNFSVGHKLHVSPPNHTAVDLGLMATAGVDGQVGGSVLEVHVGHKQIKGFHAV